MASRGTFASIVALFGRVVEVRPRERRAVVWAFAQAFLLLSSLYVVRPLRDEMGIRADVESMQWLFTGTFAGMLAVVPLYARGVARLGRRVLVPAIYLFMATTMVGLFGLATALPESAMVHLARFSFVWLSLFNLLAVSVFWSLLADLFEPAQGKRLFGFVAAGGSVGAIVGPLVTTGLVQLVQPSSLFLAAAVFLAAAALCARRLEAHATRLHPTGADPLGGHAWAGVRLLLGSPSLRAIAAYVVLLTTISTIMYFEQAHVMGASIDDSARRTALFASMDLAVNVLAVTTQALLTARIMRWIGLAGVLVALPLVSMLALVAVAWAPVLGVLVVAQVLRRATSFSLAKPARELLFTLVSREARYKSKNVIDTVVYRGGDMLAGWTFAGLQAVGLGLAAIAWIGVPLAGGWAILGHRLGRRVDAQRPLG